MIEPIQSRCAVFRFRPVKDEDVKKYLGRIAEEEKIQITADGFEALTDVARGDLRRATNTLQVASSITSKVNRDSVYSSSTVARPEDLKELLTLAVEGNFTKARRRLEEIMETAGLSGEDVVRQVHRTAFEMDLPDDVKIAIVSATGETEFRIVEGGNEKVQLDAMLARFSGLVPRPKDKKR